MLNRFFDISIDGYALRRRDSAIETHICFSGISDAPGHGRNPTQGAVQ
jgi:hypothetical protein